MVGYTEEGRLVTCMELYYSISLEVGLKNHDFKVSDHLAMTIVNSPVGISKNYQSNMLLPSKSLPKM